MSPAIDFSSKAEGYHAQSRTEMTAFVPPNSRMILDVGCGEGVFGAGLKTARGAVVWGIEVDPDAGNLARQRLDKVFIGDAAALIASIPAQTFDCIIFNDVLEHLVDPYSLLKITRGKLGPGGVVVSSIPNIRYFYTLRDLVLKREWTYQDHGILDKTHLRFFTEKSMIEMFRSLGYGDVKTTGINPIRSWKLALLNTLLFGLLSDSKFLQFACVAKPAQT